MRALRTISRTTNIHGNMSVVQLQKEVALGEPAIIFNTPEQFVESQVYGLDPSEHLRRHSSPTRRIDFEIRRPRFATQAH